MTIDIDFDGTILWNGEAIPDRAALEVAAARRPRRRPISPRSTCGRTSWSSTSRSPTVLASAQRLGVTKLGMIGNEQFVK